MPEQIRPEETEPSPEPINGPESEEDFSTESSRASAGSPFVADAGPGFDPEHAAPGPEAPPAAEPDVLLELGWEEETVATLLDTQGQLLHGAIGVAEQDWLHTQADLKAIGGPLTRILNRYEPTRAAAAMGDPVALALGLGAYGVRSARERAAVLKALEPEVPITGEAAPPGSGPPADPDSLDWNLG